jgi:hypothetical protein
MTGRWLLARMTVLHATNESGTAMDCRVKPGNDDVLVWGEMRGTERNATRWQAAI